MRRIKHECHDSWQAHYLVMLEFHFSWQEAAFGEVLGHIAGARNALLLQTKCVSEVGKISSANGRVADVHFRVGSFSVRNDSQIFS